MKDKPEKTRVSLTLTPVYVEALDQLVGRGFYLNPQGVIRAGLSLLFQFHGIESFTDKRAELEGAAPSEH